MKLLLFLLNFVSVMSFNVNFNQNGFNINDIYIKYNNYYEENVTNNNPINFDIINNNQYISTIMQNNDIYFETTNIYYESNNSLRVILLITDYNFQNINNNFILNIVFNKKTFMFTTIIIPYGPINFNGKHYLQIGDFNMEFSNNAIVDDIKQNVKLERFGNYFYLHFPSFKNYILYEYTIFQNINNF